MRDKTPISRIGLACLACRTKKVRCGGQKPVCDNCARSHSSCSYDPGSDQRKPYSKAYVSTLQARITSLEKELERGRSRSEPQGDVVVDPPAASSSTIPVVETTATATAATSALHDTELVGQLARRGGSLLRHHDAGAAEDQGTFRFYGASSGRNFQLAHCAKALNLSSVAAASQQRLAELGFDTDGRDDELIDIYFQRANPTLLLLDETIFRRHLTLAPEEARHVSHLLINAVCAVGAVMMMAESVEASIAAAEMHLERARALIYVEDEYPQLTTVQALALLGYCEAVRGRESRGWLYTGMACRLALELGIPRDSHEYTERGWMTTEDMVARHRTLFALYTLENLLSLFHGRPPCLDASVISATAPSFRNLPAKALSIPCPVNSASDRGSRKSCAACHDNTEGYGVGLFELTNYAVEIFDRLYVNPILKGADASARWTGWASDLNLRLAQWNADLPRGLKCSLTRGQIPLARALFLQLVFHALVILLNRPFLALGAHLLEAAFSAKACHNASRSVAVLAGELDMRHGAAAAHNYVIFSIHTAITISLLNAKSSTGTVRREARNDLRSLVATLRSLSLTHRNALPVLKLITRLVWRTFSQETDFAEQVCPSLSSNQQQPVNLSNNGAIPTTAAASSSPTSITITTPVPLPSFQMAISQVLDAELSNFAFVDWDSHEALGFGGGVGSTGSESNHNVIAGIDIQPWLGPSSR